MRDYECPTLGEARFQSMAEEGMKPAHDFIGAFLDYAEADELDAIWFRLNQVHRGEVLKLARKRKLKLIGEAGEEQAR